MKWFMYTQFCVERPPCVSYAILICIYNIISTNMQYMISKQVSFILSIVIG